LPEITLTTDDLHGVGKDLCTAVCSGGIHLPTITEIIAWRENGTITDAICRLAPLNITAKLCGSKWTKFTFDFRDETGL